MSWTVPNDCYYCVYKNKITTYYNANATVPDADSPENASGFFALVDFANGYIYVTGFSYQSNSGNTVITIDNNNKSFVFDSSNYGGLVNREVFAIASTEVYMVQGKRFELNGFAFGDGSNILNKFFADDYKYRLYYAFSNRTDITSVTIPLGVVDIAYAFDGCTSLVSVSTIPSTVISMAYCFNGCTALTGEVSIDANPTSYSRAFYNTTQPIVLSGNSTMLDTLVTTSNNGNVLMWSLSTTISAQRDETITTDVDVSVTVTRFQGNNETLSSLALYLNGTATAATWNDPTLTMTSTTVTFTTTLSNIGDGSTYILSVIATDAYGSSAEVSTSIPIAFYTMDVQAGGKEVSFGALADDDLTSYPDGLFKCNMDALFTNDAIITNPYFSLDTTASPGTTDGDLYAAIVALGWDSDVIV